MFKFFYKSESYLTRLTLILALIVFVSGAASVFLMSGQTLNLIKLILKNRPPKLELIVIEADDCPQCFDISRVTGFIKNNIPIQKYSRVKKYKMSEGAAGALIKKYGIKILPSFVIYGDAAKANLNQLVNPDYTAFSDEKTFVYKNELPPYYNLENKKVEGLFKITYLTDAACADCYDVYLHDRALENLMMAASASSTIDVVEAQGKELIKKYNIRYAPTVLLEGDLGVYKNFQNLWQTVGTVEPGDVYVFRDGGLKLMGVYKDLKTGRLLNRVK